MMTEFRASVNADSRKAIQWAAGFFEEGTPQSSTRLSMYTLLGAAIHYAYRTSPPPDIEILGTLVAAALACGGIKLAKDIKTIKADTAKSVGADLG